MALSLLDFKELIIYHLHVHLFFKSYPFIPLICLVLMAHTRRSAKIKMISETGHLCFVDLVSSKDEDTIPFVLTQESGL